MVRLRSQRQVHFLRVFPLSSLLLLSFSFFLSSLVAPIWASPRIIRYFPSESTPGSKSKMRKGKARKVERAFRFFLIKLPRGSSSLFSFSFLIIGPRYTLVHLQTMPNTSIAFVVHFPPSRDIGASRGNASREPMRIDREKSDDSHAASFLYPRSSRRSIAPC